MTEVDLVAINGRSIRKVLIVDDHEPLLNSIARDFAREGIEPLKAQNRDAAMDLAVAKAPDLALIDLFLVPPDNGLRLITELKALSSAPFCILMSAHMTVAHAVLGIRAGADDVFLKPFTAKQTLQRMSGGPPPVPDLKAPTLDQIEWEHIARVLGDYDGNITHAAEALGVFRQSLQRKIQKHAPRALTPGESPKSTRSRRRPSRPT